MSDLDLIGELTDRVEALVADGRWLEASETESRRQEALARYVAQSDGRPEGLAELYERNRQMLAVARRSRDAVIEESKTLVRNKRAVEAYRTQGASIPAATRAPGDRDEVR